MAAATGRPAASRSIGELSKHEWFALCDAFADEILMRFGVAGSIAGAYSLYDRLDEEYERARRAEGQQFVDAIESEEAASVSADVRNRLLVAGFGAGAAETLASEIADDLDREIHTFIASLRQKGHVVEVTYDRHGRVAFVHTKDATAAAAVFETLPRLRRCFVRCGKEDAS